MDVQKVVMPEGAKELTIFTGTAPSPLPPFNYKGFQYMADSVSSFISLVKSKGNKENAVVFADEAGLFAILDDRVINRNKDSITMDYKYATKVLDYREILEHGKVFKVKELIDFLKRRDKEEINGYDELLYAVKNFKYVSNITGDFTFDSRNNYTFAINVKECEGTVRIPTSIFVSLPLFRDSEWLQEMEIEIEIQKPKEAQEQPLFMLSCPKFALYEEKAREVEEEKLRKELDGWLVVHGSDNSPQ